MSCYNPAMVEPGDFRRRRERRDNADPASDGSANAERRERQSGLRRILRERFPLRVRSNLLPALHFLQHEHGYLPEWALQVVGWHLRVPASEVYGSATSYSELRLDTPPLLVITVCTGLACWRAGSDALLASAQQTADERARVETAACAFICGVAPVVGVTGQGSRRRWLGRMNPGRLAAVIAEASQ